MASSSTTAIGRARCIRAARWCRPLLALAQGGRTSGKALIEAMVAGYETVTAIGGACHPDLRQRGFHPTGAVAVLGAAMAAGKLRGLAVPQLAHALGLAASSAAGLFAFVNGGADIKRLHAGHAAREGLQAALLGAARRRRAAPCHRGARRLPAGLRLRPRRAGARHRAAARGAVSHHRLLHQALSVLPPHPAGRRGADRPAHRREHRDRRGHAHRCRDLPHRGRACANRLGRFRQRPAQLPLSDGAGARVPRHQARAFQRRAARAIRRSARSPPRSMSRRRPTSTGSIRACGRRA